jgi:hypothetical protein
MKLVLSLLLLLPCVSFSQTNDSIAIRQTVEKLFDGMRKGDSAMVHSTFHPAATLQSVSKKTGEPRLVPESVGEFLKAVGTPHQQVWNEVIWSYEIRMDGDMATVWAPYTFYADEIFSHCGVNVFILVRISSKWVITSITDTRRREPCKTK